MSPKKHKRYSYKKGIIIILAFCFVFSASITPKNVSAGVDAIGGPTTVVDSVLTKVWEKLATALKKAGSSVFQTTLRSALSKFAYDSATYLGTGAGGQKPMWEQNYWTDYAKNMGDVALSEFLTTLGDEWDMDFCQPNLQIKTRIGAGLVVDYTPATPDCGWQTLKNNWTSEYDKWASMSEGGGWGYLDMLANSFNPESNDIGIAMSLMDKSTQELKNEEGKALTQISVNKGWLDVRGISGKQESIPGATEGEAQQTRDLVTNSFGQTTGDIFVDAANIFANQFLITSINSALKSYKDFRSAQGDDDVAKPTNPWEEKDSDPSGSFSYDSFSSSLKKVLSPTFKTRADYDVLADLMICYGEDTYTGPSNCVISQSFGRAVQEQNTLAEAIENGSIPAGMIFRKTGDYNTSLTERSLMILRKYRIVPVGWEEALKRAEEMKGYGIVTISDMMSCFDGGPEPVEGSDPYREFSSNFDWTKTMEEDEEPYEWCEGLVDPTWVLKANSHYCAKEGYGGHVLSKQVINYPAVGGEEARDEILYVRSDSYCADERSCIRENAVGDCEYYGYCTEEKRIWDFNSDSCDPEFNTCQSFTSSTGKKLSLLKNTLDYGACSADNAGCGIYSTKAYEYNATEKTIVWDYNYFTYFNRKAETCSSGAESCNEYIRTKSGFGHNFASGLDIEEEFDVLSGTPFSRTIEVGPDNYSVAGETFTISFYSACAATSTLSVSSISNTYEIDPSNDYTYRSFSYIYPTGTDTNNISFSITATDCSIRQLKLERGSTGTYYSNYRGNGLIYMKTIPEYLEGVCYENPGSGNYSLKDDAPTDCYQYARLCNIDELGCDFFRLRDGRGISAKAMDKDYCPTQCVGYDIYVQKESLFESDTAYKFIPASARSCSANSVGCTQFTNLEELSSGGEAIEYYSSLRHCMKPEEGTCSNFYSWEGSESAGYQLVAYVLSSEQSVDRPILTVGNIVNDEIIVEGEVLLGIFKQQIDGVDVCSNAIFNYPISDHRYNSDCREFYNQAGQIFYTLYTNTVTCSNDCKTYRMTDRNIDQSINTVQACNNLNTLAGKNVANWGTVEEEGGGSVNVCFRCLNGGIWDSIQGSCLYKAIPGEGKPCQSGENLCREYSGNEGNSIRIISSADFTNISSSWSGDISSSNEALNNNGKSLAISGNGQAVLSLETLLEKDNSYTLSFLAKSSISSSEMEAYFTNNSGQISRFSFNKEGDIDVSIIDINNNWKLYRVNLDSLDYEISGGERLVIRNISGSTIYIDDLILSELNNRYYLIKGSWNTPNVCYYNNINEYVGVNYNLGCSTYTDRSNSSHNLRQFSKLCDASAVGCELMIDTHNATSKEEVVFNASSTPPVNPTVTVPADNYILAVYDTTKLCNQADKGCSLMGHAYSGIYDNNYEYRNVYIKNNPDKYSTILCSESEVGCESWRIDGQSSTTYFKDPMENVCRFEGGTWYVGLDSNSTSTCPVDPNKTIGNEGAVINQPTISSGGVYFAGVCPVSQSSCTEYIDPSSSFNANMMQNTSFSINISGLLAWDASSQNGDELNGVVCNYSGDNILCNGFPTSVYRFKQNISTIEKNKLYALDYSGYSAVRMKCSNDFYQLNSSNVLEPLSAGLWHQVSTSSKKMIFNSKNNHNNSSCEILVEMGTEKNPNSLSVNLRGLVIDYKYNNDLDFSSCNGVPNFNNGCIVFNQRSYNYNNGYSSLNMNSENYQDTSSGENRDANAIIKVRPDRICDKWLSCLSSLNTEDDNGTTISTCVDIGLCTSMNNSGLCQNFVSSPGGDRQFNPSRDANASGYSVLNNYYLDRMLQVGSELFYSDFEDSFADWSISDPNNQIKKSTDVSVGTGGGAFLKSSFDAYPSPNGYNFIAVSGNTNDYTGGSINVKSSRIPVDSSKTYYINFWMNSANASGLSQPDPGDTDKPEDSQVVMIIRGYSEETPVGQRYIYADISNKNWQLVLGDFTTDSSWTQIELIPMSRAVNTAGGSKTFTLVSGDNFIYFDEIRVSTMLNISEEKSENIYHSNSDILSPMCRLYPSQDSLTCSSDSGGYGFKERGWEGYCLQKDPANSEVCLLWYPLDAVAGSTFGSLTTEFIGYAETSAQPYYCAQMNADFDFVDKREAFLVGTYFAPSGDRVQVVRRLPGEYGNNVADWCGDFDVSDGRFQCSNCPNGYIAIEHRYSFRSDSDQTTNATNWDAYCIPYSNSTRWVIGCKPNGNGTCNMQISNTLVGSEGSWVSSPIKDFDDWPGFLKGELLWPLQGTLTERSSEALQLLSATNGKTKAEVLTILQNYPRWSFVQGVHSWFGGDGDCSAGSYCNSNGYESFILVNNEGYYVYDYEYPVDINQTYSYHNGHGFTVSKTITTGLNSSYSPYNSTTFMVWDKSSTNVDKRVARTAYQPVCNLIYRGMVPWTSRLESSTKNIKDYNTTAVNPYVNYTKSSANIPFGAIKETDINGSVRIDKGLPYSCTGADDKCFYMRYNDQDYSGFGRIFATTDPDITTGQRYWLDSSPINKLKYLYAKIINNNDGLSVYDHTRGGDDSILSCSGTTRGDTGVCYFLPEVSNVKVISSLEEMTSTDGVYTFNQSSYYTIRFNTKVDVEQTPITKLEAYLVPVNIAGTPDWERKRAVISPIKTDPASSASNPHSVTIYVNSGRYLLAIRAEDNWNYYSCGGFDFDEDNKCADCCLGSFTGIGPGSCGGCNTN